MIVVRTAVRLGLRRSVLGIAVAALLLCALGSLIAQELAHGQRQSLEAQTAFVAQETSACERTGDAVEGCLERRGVSAERLRAYAAQTDALGARSAALQSVGGALRWSQVWLVTLLGLLVLVVAMAVTVAADVEGRRLLPAWHPRNGARRALAVSMVTGAVASAAVAVGAALGALAAAALGRGLWSLADEPEQAVVAGLGPVALHGPSATWLLGWVSVTALLSVVAWLAGRALVALVAGGAAVAIPALTTGVLPAWFPGVALPATADTWFRHRGEVALPWLWPEQPLEAGAPSTEWSALATGDPGGAAAVGALLVLLVVALLLPAAARRRPA